jgi:hypothetical protein
MKTVVKIPLVREPQTRGVRVTSFIVCDDARREFNGKEILIGVYNNVIIFPSFPSVMPNLVFRIALYSTDMGVKVIKFTVVDDVIKRTVLNSETQFDFMPQDSSYVFGYGVAGYPFQASTKLVSSISVGGEKNELPDVIVRMPISDAERIK